MKDALGNDLIIGQVYGYSRSENGITTVKVGELVKITEKQVSLEVQQSKRALYNKNVEDRGYTNKIISVKANGLFPVYDNLLSRIKHLANPEYCQNSEDTQRQLESINELLTKETPHIKDNFEWEE
jgi:hypothetical protein